MTETTEDDNCDDILRDGITALLSDEYEDVVTGIAEFDNGEDSLGEGIMGLLL